MLSTVNDHKEWCSFVDAMYSFQYHKKFKSCQHSIHEGTQQQSSSTNEEIFVSSILPTPQQIRASICFVKERDVRKESWPVVQP